MGERVSCEILIVGGGPAGLAAAAAACGHADVLLLDENPSLGGQIYRAKEGAPSPEADRIAPLRIWQRARVQTGLSVHAIDSDARIVRASQLQFRYQKLILASGARELLLPFPGWTLPGVFGAGGLQALVKQGFQVRNKRVVLGGTGPLLLAVAKYLEDAGADVLRIYEQTSPSSLASMAAQMWRFPKKAYQGLGFLHTSQGLRAGSWIKRALGDGRLSAIEATDGAQTTRIECDLLAVGYGLVPNLELPRLAGCRIENGFVEVDDLQRTSTEHIYCAGEPTGIGGLEKAIAEGAIAGLAAAGRVTEAAKLEPEKRRALAFMGLLDRTYALRPEVLAMADAETTICRCEDVSLASLKDCSSFREAKLHTRLGMGPCQGRLCGAACQAMFGWEPPSVRPPIVPVRVADLIEN